MSYCKYAKLIRDGKTNYPLGEHQADCDTCQADLEIDKLLGAADVLCEVHTRDDSQIGFNIPVGASPGYVGSPPMDTYIDSWRTLRKAVGRTT